MTEQTELHARISGRHHESPMRVCLICVEIFAWGKYGGFGRATRVIGGELARRGMEVFAVVPRRDGQKPVEQLDGITVLSFPRHRPWSARALYADCRADIYHSSEPSLGTYLAQRAMPGKRHIVTMRDTRELADWKMEYSLPSAGKLQVIANYLYEDNPLVHRAVRNADAIYCAAHLLVEKAQRKYRLPEPPQFLPTPVDVPTMLRKSSQPTVCYVGRLDRRKRPEVFLDLAKQFPHVRFIAAGSSRDVKWDRYLRAKYADVPNLEMPGFIDQFDSRRHSELLEQSWIMVNTATREGLPNAFLEAAAHGCAILSGVNPDDFASEFGFHAAEDQFAEGLRSLLENDNWRRAGARGREYVKKHYESSRAIDLHRQCYSEIL